MVKNIKIFHLYHKRDADDTETHLRRIIDSSCLIPELQAIKVLFYAESVGVVTFGHMTKMAVTPFDPPLSKTTCYIRKLHVSMFYRTEVTLPIEVLHCGNMEFRISFCENNG